MKQKSSFLYTEKKKSSLFFSQKGIALVTTLIMMVLLAGWALTMNKKVRDVVFETSAMKSRFLLYDKARAGVFIAEKILVKDKESSQIDSVQEFWADQDKIAEYLSVIGYSSNELKIKITDVHSKIQINALVDYPHKKNLDQVKLWERFLDGLKLEYPELIKNPYEIINPLLDWLDFGDEDAVTGLSGAEKPYYDSEHSLPPSNGPMKSIEELGFVKGITEKLWNKVYNSGIAHDYLTIDGDVTRSGKNFSFSGQININTAPQAVVAALIKDTAFYHMAAEICSFREEKSEGRYLYELDGQWYKNCPGCAEVPLDEKLITTSSDTFIIQSLASDNDMKIIIECIIKRYQDKNGKWDTKILKWKSDQI